MHVHHTTSQTKEVGPEWTNSVMIIHYLLLTYIVIVVGVVLFLMEDK